MPPGRPFRISQAFTRGASERHRRDQGKSGERRHTWSSGPGACPGAFAPLEDEAAAVCPVDAAAAVGAAGVPPPALSEMV
jgi:hypothetical protein